MALPVWQSLCKECSMNAVSLSEDPILTVAQVAQYLQISKSKIYYLIQRRRLPCIRLGRNVRVRQSELLKWLDLQAERGDAPARPVS